MQQKMITFWVGGQMYCLPLLMIGEFCPSHTVTPVAGVDARIRGVAHLRGASTAVLDMRRIFGLKPREVSTPTDTMLVLAQADLCEEAQRSQLVTFEEPVILEVDTLAEIVTLDDSKMHATPAHLDEPFYLGVYATPDRDLIALNFSKLISFLALDFQETR